MPLTNTYAYDAANRLTSVDSITYTWDNNGNASTSSARRLLNDGVNTYTYDSANQLTGISNPSSVSSYQYNGLGDRLSQTVNGNTSTYTLDLNSGPTQVLSDGTNTYLYGVGRIAQVNTATLITDYFLTDALGSVRQLTDAQGEVTLANAYEPYGTLAQSAGSAQTSYGFTGEYTDPSGMVYLRARYYSPATGRFQTRDTWMGDYNSPLPLNRWNYVEGNPVNYADPSGFIKQSEAQEAYQIVIDLLVYNVYVEVDWGGSNWYNAPFNPLVSNLGCSWLEGDWSLTELKALRKGVVDLSRAMGGLNKFVAKLGHVMVVQEALSGTSIDAAAVGTAHSIKVNSLLNDKFTNWSAVHELGHVWDGNNNWKLSSLLEAYTGGYTLSPSTLKTPSYCSRDIGHELPGCNVAGYYYGGIPPKTSGNRFNRFEDFAESVAAYVYPADARSEVLDQLVKYKKKLPSDVYQIYEAFLYYDDFRSTERGLFIAGLLK